MWPVNGILICLFFGFSAWLQPVVGYDEDTDWSDDFGGHGTVHERLGQAHVGDVIYTEYESNAVYANFSNRSTSSTGIEPAYGFTNWLFDTVYSNKYLKSMDANTMKEKFVQNDWVGLLSLIKWTIPWILFLSILALIMPFIGIVYCCFCCCRCKRTCPPCVKSKERRLRLICSILMLLLILGLLAGFLISFLANKQLNKAPEHNNDRIAYYKTNACIYLKDVSNHLNNLVDVNYKEFETHSITQTMEAYAHIMLDLTDKSGGTALEELERILDNLNEARKIMKNVLWLQKRLIFLVSQLRDQVRQIGRILFRIMKEICNREKCTEWYNLNKPMHRYFWNCGHLDALPDSELFLKTLENGVKASLSNIPKIGIQNLWKIGENLKEHTTPDIQPLTDKIEMLGMDYLDAKEKLYSIIEKTVSRIHRNVLNASKSIDDINDSLGRNHNFVDLIVCLILLLVLIILILGLIFGVCVRNSKMGSKLMLIAILLIFCVFSFLILVGLFHFMLGWILHSNTCRAENIKDPEETTIYSLMGNQTSYQNKPTPMTLIEILQENGEYNVESMKSYKLFDENNDLKWNEFKGDLSKILLITPENVGKIQKTLTDLYPYQGIDYVKQYCKPLVKPGNFAAELFRMGYDTIYLYYFAGHFLTYWNRFYMILYEIVNVGMDSRLTPDLEKAAFNIMDRLTAEVGKIDNLIVHKNRNFNDTLTPLLKSIVNSQRFLQEKGVDYINSVGANMTQTIGELFEEYQMRLAKKILEDVAPCEPLVNIYRGNSERTCHDLVNPINALWLGVILSSLLYIPVLFVAHRLMCLFKVHGRGHAPNVLFMATTIDCPNCAGRQLAGTNDPFTPTSVDIVAPAAVATSASTFKRKND